MNSTLPTIELPSQSTDEVESEVKLNHVNNVTQVGGTEREQQERGQEERAVVTLVLEGGEKPAAETREKPLPEADEKAAAEAGEKSVPEAGEKSVPETGDKSAAEAGEKPAVEADEDMGHTYSCLTKPPTKRSTTAAAAEKKAEESTQENMYAELNQVRRCR